jgi:hypothetical protein
VAVVPSSGSCLELAVLPFGPCLLFGACYLVLLCSLVLVWILMLVIWCLSVVWSLFWIWCFEFVSDFELRISCFGFWLAAKNRAPPFGAAPVLSIMQH